MSFERYLKIFKFIIIFIWSNTGTDGLSEYDKKKLIAVF